VATLSHSDLMTLWVLHGGTQQSADVAAAIAQAESGGCQYAKAGPTDDRPVKQCTYRYTTGENSYGLWQINRNAHPQYTASELYTQGGNVDAAVDISTSGASFSAWSTYKNGAYKNYLTGTVSVTPQPGSTFTVASTDSATHSLRGWNDANRAVAMHLPTNLRRAKLLDRATSRLIAKGRGR
jgi:Lysozyme like domain